MFEKKVGKLEPKEYNLEINFNKFITIDVNTLIMIKNASFLIPEEINNLSMDSKIFLTDMFLNNKISTLPFNQSQSSNELLKRTEMEKYFNNWISVIAYGKEKIKLNNIINEKKFIDLFFKSKFINFFFHYTKKEILEKMNFDEKLMTKKIFKEKEKRKSHNWFLDLIEYYPSEKWIDLAMKDNFFSPFKFFGLRLELAAGKNIPITYNKNIKRPPPNHGGLISSQQELKQEFLYIKDSLKNKTVEKNELKDWYIFLIKSNLVDLFEITSSLFPLTKDELEQKEINSLIINLIKNNQYNCTWQQLYLKINLENTLQKSLQNSKKSKI